MFKLVFGAALIVAAVTLAIGKNIIPTIPKIVRIAISAVAGAVGAILIILALAHPVAAGNVGVVTVFGKPQDNIATEGLNFLPPWYDVVQLSKRTETVQDITAAFTSDLQQADVTCSIMFHLPQGNAVNIFRNYGRSYVDGIVMPVFRDTLKGTIGKYTANTAVSDRGALALAVKESFADRMEEYGFAVDDVAITNIDFSDTFESSVEAANKARQDTIRVQQEAEQAKAKAEGEAAARKAAADAQAYETTTVAAAQASANKELAESITPTLVEYYKIQRWNGEVPTVSGTGATIVDIGDITGNDE